MKRQRFGALDGWRGVCALLVAQFHLSANSHVYALPIVRNAWLFVDFFFVLSGFVISHAYCNRLGDSRAFGSFVIRRFGRLWPLHVAVLAAMVGLEFVDLAFVSTTGIGAIRTPFSGRSTVPAIFTNLLLIHSLAIHRSTTWNSPSWSISTEFYTYIVFALIYIATRRFWSSAVLPLAIAVAAGIAVFVLAGTMDTTVDFGFFRCVCGFFVGHVTYRIWSAGQSLRFGRQWWLAEISSIVAAAVFVSFVGSGPSSIAAPLVFAVVVWVFAQDGGPVAKLMNTLPLASLGAWSYSIYMVHSLVLRVMTGASDVVTKLTGTALTGEIAIPSLSNPVALYNFGNKWVMDGLTLAYLATVVALSSLTYAWIETPARHYFNARASRLKGPNRGEAPEPQP